jgi:lactoylglutathione lyase
VIARLDHVAVSVRDLDRSIEFYSRHFGLEHYFTQPSPAPHLKAIAYLRSAQGVVELMHIPEHQMGGGFHFCFVTDDFNADTSRR